MGNLCCIFCKQKDEVDYRKKHVKKAEKKIKKKASSRPEQDKHGNEIAKSAATPYHEHQLESSVENDLGKEKDHVANKKETKPIDKEATQTENQSTIVTEANSEPKLAFPEQEQSGYEEDANENVTKRAAVVAEVEKLLSGDKSQCLMLIKKEKEPESVKDWSVTESAPKESQEFDVEMVEVLEVENGMQDLKVVPTAAGDEHSKMEAETVSDSAVEVELLDREAHWKNLIFSSL